MKPEARTPQMGTCRCVYSTGIDGELTKGRGKLDDYGYWEFPCTHEVAAPVAPEKEARPTGQPERDYCAKCGVPRIIHEHPKANFGHGFLSDKMVAELAGDAVPQTPPDARRFRDLWHEINDELFDLDNASLECKLMQAYAEAVTAQLCSEINSVKEAFARRPALANCTSLYEMAYAACEMASRADKYGREAESLQAEVTRLKATLRKAETELWRVPCQGLASWREATDGIYKLLGEAGEAKKGTPQT